MPQVPYLETPSVQSEGLPGRSNPRFDTNVSTESFGAGLAQGLEAVGTAGSEEDARLKQQNDQLRLVDANTQLEQAKNTLLYGQADDSGQMSGGAFSRKGTDALDLPNQVIPKYDQVANQIASTLTPDQQRQFKLHTTLGRGEFYSQLNEYEFKEMNRFADSVYDNGAKQSITNAELNWQDPQQLLKARGDLHALVTMEGDRKGWGPDERAQNLSSLEAQLHQNVVGQMLLEKNPQAAQNYLASIPQGQLPPALAERLQQQVKVGQALSVSDSILDTYRNQGPVLGTKAFASIDARTDLPDDVKDQVRSDVQKGLGLWHDEQRQKQSDALEQLEERIASGKADMSDRSTIWDLYRSGVFSPSEAGSAIGRLEKAQQKQVDDDAQLQQIDKAYQQGTPLDPKDKDIKEGVAALFNHYTRSDSKNPVTPGSQEWINRGADIAAKTGVTPQPVIDWARTQLVSGEPAAAAQAAQALQRQHDANPTGLAYAMDDKVKALAKLINDAHKAGTDDETAVKNARSIIDMPTADTKRLDDVWKDKGYGKTSLGALTSQLKALPGYDAGMCSSDATIPPTMVGQFQQLRHDYFKLTNGNADQASQLAFNDLRNTWGVTQVNGKRELMQFAPEAMHPGLTTQAIRADMEASAAGHTEDPTKVRLLVTPETYNSNGQRFALGIPDKFGAYSALTDERGRIIPYQVPDATAAVKAAQAKAAQAGMDRLKARQASERERERAELDSINSAQQIGGLM